MTADKTLLRMKYADIVRVLALRTGVSMEDALKRFYESREYRLVSQGISDQHCMTPDYIVDDILRESDKNYKGTGPAQMMEDVYISNKCNM